MKITFLGHAAFSIHALGSSLCIDPYPFDRWKGRLSLRPITEHFNYTVITHDHPDHNGVADLNTTQIMPNHQGPIWKLSSSRASHDEFGGRLRGGQINILRIRVGRQILVHCGDLGERPNGELLAWLKAVPIDVLCVPVGGYYTLGPDGAAELVAALSPRYAIPFHSANDGLNDPKMAQVRDFLRRFQKPIFASFLETKEERATKTQIVRLFPNKFYKRKLATK